MDCLCATRRGLVAVYIEKVRSAECTYRIVEKLHLMRVFNNAVASYIFVCALVFVCAVIGSILFQKVYRLAYDKYLKRSAL